MGQRFFKLSLKFLGGEIDCRNMIPRHEIKELVAIKAQEVCCLTLGKTMFAKEFHD